MDLYTKLAKRIRYLYDLYNPSKFALKLNAPSISIFVDHYFSLPIHNEELLRKLYIEMDLSTYKISEITGWSKTSIADALRSLKIIKQNRKGPRIKPQKTIKKTKRVVNKKEK